MYALISCLLVLLAQSDVPGARVYCKAARYFSGKQSCLQDRHSPRMPPQTKVDTSRRGFSTMCQLSIKYINKQHALRQRALSEESGGNHSTAQFPQDVSVVSCEDLQIMSRSEFSFRIEVYQHRLTRTSWQCIPSVIWLRTPFPPLDYFAAWKMLPLADTKGEMGVNLRVKQSFQWKQSTLFSHNVKPNNTYIQPTGIPTLGEQQCVYVCVCVSRS